MFVRSLVFPQLIFTQLALFPIQSISCNVSGCIRPLLKDLDPCWLETSGRRAKRYNCHTNNPFFLEIKQNNFEETFSISLGFLLVSFLLCLSSWWVSRAKDVVVVLLLLSAQVKIFSVSQMWNFLQPCQQQKNIKWLDSNSYLVLYLNRGNVL